VPTTLRPRGRFLLLQAGQRLFVAAVFVVGAVLVYPPRNGGWVFFGPFAVLAILATVYGFSVAVMGRRMRLTFTNGEISYLEYFKPRSVPIGQATAFQLIQRRGQYGPGVLEGRVLGANGAPILHGMAMGAFDPIGVLRLAASIHKPILGAADVVVENWLRPSLRRRLGTPVPEQQFGSGDLAARIDVLRSQRTSGRLEIKCPPRKIEIDFIVGRALRTHGYDDVRQCPQGSTRFTPLALGSDVLAAFAETLTDPSYFMEI
jgi:hypothetical protein